MPHLLTQLTYPPDLDSHSAYKRVFRPGRLTFGFIMPLKVIRIRLSRLCRIIRRWQNMLTLTTSGQFAGANITLAGFQ